MTNENVAAVDPAARAAAYSDAEIGLLAAWLTAGLSASEIAERLSIHRHAFVSRNGIIGIVHRNKTLKAIGFSRIGKGRGDAVGPARIRRPVVAKTPKVRTAQKASPPKQAIAQPPKDSKTKQNLNAGKRDPGFVVERIKPPVAEAMAYDLASRRVELIELGWQDCRFAVNDAATGEPHLFCGAVTEGGSRYCPHHAARAFNGRTYIRAAAFAPKRVALVASFAGGA